MYEKLITLVDGFFENPHDLRERAFDLSYTTPPSQTVPDARGPIAEQTPCDLDTRETTLHRLRNCLPSELKFAARSRGQVLQ